MFGYRWNMLYRDFSVLLFVSSLVLVEIANGLLSCGKVADVFAKRVGLADNVPMSPVTGASLSACSGNLRHTQGASCCTTDMDSQFLPASADYLREHIQTSNSGLKDRITQSLRLYQEHLTLSVKEAHNRTSDVLSSLYKIPRKVHRTALDSFFQKLGRYLLSSDEQHHLPEIIDSFFKSLFPIAFNYVLSDASKTSGLGEAFNECLEKHYEDIEPFGNVPKHFGMQLRYGFNRARIYTETLEVMLSTMDSTNNLLVHADCQKAISRLHFCPLCSGEVAAKPCRGLCLNVMRGCLSGISEISSSWDDLVVDFENLHLGMFKQHNAQELLAYLDGNITDALLQAMDDGSRIFTQVEELCKVPSHSVSDSDLYKKFFTPEGMLLSHPSNRIQSIRKDIASLIAELEESKGFFQRIADGLCRTPSVYEQEMQSHQCWNGSAVGRYLREVPEANVISQATHNMEVRITLIPDSALLQVKDTLAHMKRNLSALHNEELMLSDQSYKSAVVGSGGGIYNTGRDVIIDDEDFVDRNSGSGSGAGGDDEDDRRRIDKPVYTSRPTDRGQGNLPSGGGGSISNEGRDKGSRGGSRPSGGVAAVSVSMVLLCVSAVILRVCL